MKELVHTHNGKFGLGMIGTMLDAEEVYHTEFSVQMQKFSINQNSMSSYSVMDILLSSQSCLKMACVLLKNYHWWQ